MLDKKTKKEKEASIPNGCSEKCMRGDTSDNVFSISGVREKGLKIK